jgi:signal transduction histidine kinase
LKPAIPSNEALRLAALRTYEIIGSEPEPPFDALVRLAAHVARAPMALITLVDGERRWFKARYGIDYTETPRDTSFCGHVVASETPLVVRDSHDDERFVDNPFVTGAPHVRFYAGMPLRTRQGFVLGTLCVLDRMPHEPTPPQLDMLGLLAHQAVELLEARRREISARKHLEHMHAEFLSTVSHELRTPLTAIRGSLGLVAGGITGELPAPVKEYVDIALTNSERLVRLVDDLLDVSSATLELRIANVPLLPLLAEIVAAHESIPAHAQLALVGEIPDVAIAVDPERFQQLIAKLVSNAAKFSPAGTVIELSAALTGSTVAIAVRDHGPGVPDALRARVFERFVQADSSSTRATGGAGLGLAICKSIVEQLGGSIRVEDAAGGGARFIVEVPACQTAHDRPRS